MLFDLTSLSIARGRTRRDARVHVRVAYSSILAIIVSRRRNFLYAPGSPDALALPLAVPTDAGPPEAGQVRCGTSRLDSSS
eukprot:COSAG02_NODE_6541_length_3506_cov_3.733490_5_plen_81_part_00